MKFILAELLNYMFGWEYILFRGGYYSYEDEWQIRRVINYNGVFFIKLRKFMCSTKLIKVDGWSSKEMEDIGLSEELCKKWYLSS